MSKPRYIMVCSTCGSEDVLRDAYAEWDVVDQRWHLASVYDKGSFCRKCDGECRIVDREVIIAHKSPASSG